VQVNNPQGSTMGQTITTDTGTGNIVVALVAVLTTFGVQHLWSVVVFAYHQMRVNNKPTDGLYRQQQALMRALPTPVSMLSDCLKLWWVWKMRINRTFLGSLPLIGLATVFAVATIVVGTFSSYLVKGSGIEVLVSSPHCGPVLFPGMPNETASRETDVWYTGYRNKVAESTLRYVRDCYSNGSAALDRCNIFTRPTIPSKQERTSCPFDNSMCKNFSQPALAFDTGLLDLNDHFGLNLAGSDKMKFRQKTTCAIIEFKGHYDVVDFFSPLRPSYERWFGRRLFTEETVMRLYLGKTMAANWSLAVHNAGREGPERKMATA
jgi:hypothetical protein